MSPIISRRRTARLYFPPDIFKSQQKTGSVHMTVTQRLPMIHEQKQTVLNTQEIIETISIDCLIFGLNKGQLEILLV
jgi:hypothetical protein